MLDTSALAPLVDEGHRKHLLAKTAVSPLGDAPIYVSVIALAEMKFGHALHQRATGTKLHNAEKMLTEAQTFPLLDVGPHTTTEYAELKANVAAYYLPNVTKQFRRRYVEDWINQFTSKPLGVDDNDLWICAQAREMNLIVIADDRMARIREADPRVKLLSIDPINLD